MWALAVWMCIKESNYRCMRYLGHLLWTSVDGATVIPEWERENAINQTWSALFDAIILKNVMNFPKKLKIIRIIPDTQHFTRTKFYSPKLHHPQLSITCSLHRRSESDTLTHTQYAHFFLMAFSIFLASCFLIISAVGWTINFHRRMATLTTILSTFW